MNPLRAILILPLIFTGCIGTHITMPGATDNDYSTLALPPLPTAARFAPEAARTINEISIGEELIVAPSPTRFCFTWSHPNSNATVNVYSATTPHVSAMTLRTNTASRYVELPMKPGAEYFAIRAKVGNVESGWATNKVGVLP